MQHPPTARGRSALRSWPFSVSGTRPAILVHDLVRERTLVIALVAVALVAHGLNMFNYPAFTYKDDEGIYAAQAWAILHLHQLTPYTYFYDHAPGGWLLLAAWSWLTRENAFFGTAIESGRMFVLLLHLAMVPLLYRLTRKLGGGMAAAALATLLFSLSPLAIFYQRLVLLDTIMLFWLLLSLDLLLDDWGRLSRFVLSGICFGIALLTKETAIVLAPALLFIAIQQRHQHQGRFAISAWVVPALIVASWYPLYALLKGELLPTGSQLLGVGRSTHFLGFGGGPASQVSLVDALRWQTTRDGGGMFNLNNQFWQLVRSDWLRRDAVLVVGGVAATLVNLVRGLRGRRVLVVGLLGALPLLYLGRGGVVLAYYVLVAIPFLCLNLAILLNPLFARLPHGVALATLVIVVAGLMGGYWTTGRAQPLYEARPDQAGRQAVAWMKANLAPTSRIIARDDIWVDMHENGHGGAAFPYVHSHWKVASDPAIRDGVFHNDWQTVDYLVMSPGLDVDFADSGNGVAQQALQHAHLVKHWEAAGGGESLHPTQIVELWKVDRPGDTEAHLLSESAAYLATHFAQAGRYMDAGGTVTSEGQAYALLRAAWAGDRGEFYSAWQWTQSHLLTGDGLLAWQWRSGAVQDTHSAADADGDAALALLMAGRRWNDQNLVDAGTRMAQAIWQQDVTQVAGIPFLSAGNWTAGASVIAINPSYFAPYAYHIFLEVDPSHDWQAVIDSGYRVLFNASQAPLASPRSAGLPPDWIGLDAQTGAIVPLPLDKGDTTQYGYDAARTYWRIMLDQRWSHDGRAGSYLQQAGFLRDEVQRKGGVSGVYAHDGTVVQVTPSLVGDAGAIAALLELDPASANALFAGRILGGVKHGSQGVYWDDPQDLYGQEWGWFGTALYADKLPDLWHDR